MILTATPRNDGAVILTAPTPGNYEVYRSSDGANFVKIGNITNGTIYKDLRPHMNWKWHPPSDGVIGGTWNVNEYFQFTFTGRKVGIQAYKFGDGTEGRWRVTAGVYEDGNGIETVDLSTMSNTTDPEYDKMMVWAKDYKSIVSKTIKIQRTYSASPDWGLVVNGFWVETGEQVIELGQQGYYKFKDTNTGNYSDIATVTPEIKFNERLNDIFNGILDFQLSQPNQVIDVTPAKSTPYLMWKTLPFAWAYMVTGDAKYKAAADRQFTLAQTLKYNGNITFYLDSSNPNYGMPDYNARHANSAMWCYKVFGDIAYLREAEQVAEAARVTYANYSYRGFSPVLYNYNVQDWFASIGCMYAQLWANPASIYYNSTTYLNLAKASLGCWLTFLDPTTGEVQMYGYGSSQTSHPDGVYSQFAVSNAYVANALLRNTDGTPIMPELEAGLAKAHKWEIKYSIEPMTFYSARYHSWGGAGGASRSMSAYEETKAGRYTLEDWKMYYNEHVASAYYADATALAGVESGYYPPGTEMVSQDWYSKNMINVAFGPVMANAAGIPEEWYTFGTSTPTETQDQPTYFGSQFGSTFGGVQVTVDEISLSANISSTSQIFGTMSLLQYYPLITNISSLSSLSASMVVKQLIPLSTAISNTSNVTANLTQGLITQIPLVVNINGISLLSANLSVLATSAVPIPMIVNITSVTNIATHLNLLIPLTVTIGNTTRVIAYLRGSIKHKKGSGYSWKPIIPKYAWQTLDNNHSWKGVGRKLYAITDTLYLGETKEIGSEIVSGDTSDFLVEANYQYMSQTGTPFNSGVAEVDGHKVWVLIHPTEASDFQKIVLTATVTPLTSQGDIDTDKNQETLINILYINVINP